MSVIPSLRSMATGAVQIGRLAEEYLQVIMLQQEVDSMNHVLTNLTAHAESMTVIALILTAAVVKAMRNWLRRLSQSRLTLQTDSFDLTLQTKPPSSLQESALQQPQGDDEDGNSNDDDGRIPAVSQRTHF